MEKHRTTLEKPQKTIDKLIENHRKILEKTWINPKEPQRNTEEKPYESVYREVPVGRNARAGILLEWWELDWDSYPAAKFFRGKRCDRSWCSRWGFPLK